MCGFLGTIQNQLISKDTVLSSNKHTSCRGPDNLTFLEGNLRNFNFSYVFNRLSIVDLSEDANQPMHSNEFNTSLMFNGEIFNHIELRMHLEKKGYLFKTSHSDTEVLLIGLSVYGEKFLDRLIGQFSIYFIDYKTEEILLARDRTGQKPLFYHCSKNKFVFGSNLKSVNLLANQKINENSINEYLEFNVISSPNTIFNGVYKLEPGQFIKFKILNNNIKQVISSKYWDYREYVSEKKFENEEFLSLLTQSVNQRTNADVPVAFYLSGGIDSTTIINFADKEKNLNTFSMDFPNSKYSELYWMEMVVNKYNSNHKSYQLDNSFNFSEVIEPLRLIDEPYCDPSVVPTYYLSKNISKYYKVAISGDGGDELIGGYLKNKSIFNPKLRINEKTIQKLFAFYPQSFGTGTNLLSRSKNLETSVLTYYYDKKFAESLKLDKLNFKFQFVFDLEIKEYKKVQLLDYYFYLSEMMLLKIDRMSMLNSLEVRSPLVDHRLIEFVLSRNLENEFRKSEKQLFKNQLINNFSKEFLYRKKMGFTFNLEEFVNNNFDEINNIVMKNLNFNSKKIFKAFQYRSSQTNAVRIWKLLTLAIYFENL